MKKIEKNFKSDVASVIDAVLNSSTTAKEAKEIMRDKAFVDAFSLFINSNNRNVIFNANVLIHVFDVLNNDIYNNKSFFYFWSNADGSMDFLISDCHISIKANNHYYSFFSYHRTDLCLNAHYKGGSIILTHHNNIYGEPSKDFLCCV